jgi:hypothetical protein
LVYRSFNCGEEEEMSYSYEKKDLHECCAVDCAEAGTEFLVIKSWSDNRYGGKDERSIHNPVSSGYYCRNHMAEKLDSLTRRYRSGSRDNNTSTGTGPDVNLAATTPKHS